MADNKGVVYVGPGKVEVTDLGYPKLEVPDEVANGTSIKRQAPHAVILKVVTTNICGSDQHMVGPRPNHCP